LFEVRGRLDVYVGFEYLPRVPVCTHATQVTSDSPKHYRLCVAVHCTRPAAVTDQSIVNQSSHRYPSIKNAVSLHQIANVYISLSGFPHAPRPTNTVRTCITLIPGY